MLRELFRAGEEGLKQQGSKTREDPLALAPALEAGDPTLPDPGAPGPPGDRTEEPGPPPPSLRVGESDPPLPELPLFAGGKPEGEGPAAEVPQEVLTLRRCCNLLIAALKTKAPRGQPAVLPGTGGIRPSEDLLDFFFRRLEALGFPPQDLERLEGWPGIGEAEAKEFLGELPIAALHRPLVIWSPALEIEFLLAASDDEARRLTEAGTPAYGPGEVASLLKVLQPLDPETRRERLRLIHTTKVMFEGQLRPAGDGGDALAESPAACPCCGGTRWWWSIHGVRVCQNCHPPADPTLVAEGALDKEESAHEC